ncbi:MAG: 16S rRNA (guanine(966)-N(2))-methyltransferase RsmD [Pseudomonadales bacterium]|nr:16S rRNA (guanine(966)-N(2))-methyltransferase RsmD [Pseudomonadales bacterium]
MTNQTNTVRIISGSLRSRKISFPANKAVRPTGDRVRETLFNWVQSEIDGAVCLDLFAGSGALGIEALSRGAEEVVFVEAAKNIALALKENLELLQLHSGKIYHHDALSWIEEFNTTKTFDIVFLDPPFDTDLAATSCMKLEQSNLLNSQCRIYLELASEISELTLPENWKQIKEKKAGSVYFYLFVREV